ncbi:hypothetical protein P691DRAFT_228626 [Macrolepiota fuliginosa MF-IS2]|uniref:Transmembrane protein n=1 Tax=Macrolepiota fuliginosa MF-IS2 TaxID=1400762 RepID=A0A9P5X7R0_9AGAR|nr:hypothetical protein P691DRAFT_228626 [Macrolepiota fuliginosa MF-IS2]
MIRMQRQGKGNLGMAVSFGQSATAIQWSRLVSQAFKIWWLRFVRASHFGPSSAVGTLPTPSFLSFRLCCGVTLLCRVVWLRVRDDHRMMLVSFCFSDVFFTYSLFVSVFLDVLLFWGGVCLSCSSDLR